MYQKQNPFYQVLSHFKENGWGVDYQNLALSGNLFSYMKHTNVHMSGKLHEEAGEFECTCVVSTRYPFYQETEDFLEHMTNLLAALEVDLSFYPPSTFMVTWSRSFHSKSKIKDVIDKSIDQGQRFALSVAHLINAYGRQNQRGRKTRTEVYMYPEALYRFCLLEFEERRSFNYH